MQTNNKSRFWRKYDPAQTGGGANWPAEFMSNMSPNTATKQPTPAAVDAMRGIVPQPVGGNVAAPEEEADF